MKILVTADFYPNYRVKDIIEDFEVNKLFNDFVELIKASDYVITNLECPIKPKTKAKGIEKVGPILSTNERTVEVLKKVGFNILTLANNHIRDLGDEGVEYTIETIKKNQLNYVGAGNGYEEAKKTLFINEGKVAIINIAENEFSTTFNEKYGAHGLDLIDNVETIKDAKQKAETIILIYHGGHEGYQLPSPRMKKTFRFFIENGVDVLISHHAHCYSGFERYKGGHIFYGLGNFVFDWKGKRDDIWNKGYAVELDISEEGKVDFKIIPYIQGDELPGVRLMSDDEQKKFEKDICKLNEIIKDDNKLNKEFIYWAKKMSMEYDVRIQPYSIRILRGLYRRNFLPNLVSKKKKLQLLNLIKCESHHDLLKIFLNS